MIDLIEQIQAYNSLLLREFASVAERDFTKRIDWNDRLIGIWGPKGVGKTTLLLQQLSLQVDNHKRALYLSLDHPMLTGFSLYELAESFYQHSGTILYLDEVHKYEGWSSHIKAIYDSLKNLKVVYSGSSALHIQKGQGDLSRRASLHKLPILSLREFISLETGRELKIYDLKTVLNSAQEISRDLVVQFKPLDYFRQYLKFGAYPYYRESRTNYSQRLTQVITETLESDLVFIHGLDARYSSKLKGLLRMVATSVPFVPKISDLAQAIGISRPTVSQYLEYLEEGGLISMIRAQGRGYQKLSKPEKIYLDNTNLAIVLGRDDADVETLRETFCVSQLREAGYLVESAIHGDFIVDGKTLLEIGGRSKGREQLKGHKEGYIIVDGIEEGSPSKVPLWLLGFLY